MPRLVTATHCPHCNHELPETMPRICPACAGSLQQRFLRAGCLTSAPLVLTAAGALWLAEHLLCG